MKPRSTHRGPQAAAPTAVVDLDVQQLEGMGLFTGPLGRELRALPIDDHGAASGQVVSVPSTYGLHSHGWWGDHIVWATAKALGKRPCLDKLFP